MYIKQVLIEGFKSYKDQTLTEEFSPEINVVVGANGSGKSNFFHAIRFVLNDAFINMRGDERLQLLHEGAGHRVSSAWVEVVFDNTDGRFPIDRSEVRLRRTINAKKDDYTIDKKHTNKAEVSNLLESAGFSKSNPYYIVQQGKITAMAAMSDAQRMELLKEIGGTRVYEERRKESLRILSEADSRGQQIKGMLTEIEDKLKELDAERAELVEFQALDKRRRSLQYTLYDKDLNRTQAELQKLELEASQLREKVGSAEDDQGRHATELKDLERQIRAEEANFGAAKEQAAELQARKKELTMQRSKGELDKDELEQRMARAEVLAASARKELQALRGRVGAEEDKLKKLREAAAGAEAAHAALQARIKESDSKLEALYRKQGAASQYGTREERDAALSKMIAATESKLDMKRTGHQHQQQENQAYSEMIMELGHTIGDLQAEVAALDKRMFTADKLYAEAMAHSAKLAEDRKAKQREEDAAVRAWTAAKGELAPAQRNYDTCMPNDVSRGIKGLDKLAQLYGVDMTGVHGAIIEHIKTNDAFHIAIDTIAGNRLFDVLVDNDEVASRLINGLRSRNLGRATFVPLNRVGGRPDAEPPSQFGTDVVPLLRKVQFDPRFRPAMKDMFGQVLLCKDKDVATEVCRSTDKFDCVTVDGEKFGRRGDISGGFMHKAKARIAVYDQLMTARNDVRDKEALVKEVGAAAQALQKACEDAQSKVHELDHARQQARQALRGKKAELEGQRTNEQDVRRSLDEVERALACSTADIAALQAELQGLRKEMSTEMTSQLTAAEQSELTGLNLSKKQLKEQLKAAAAARDDAVAAVEAAAAHLTGVLLREVANVEEALATDDAANDRATLELRRADLAALTRSLEETSRKAAEADKEAETLGKQAEALRRRRDGLKDAAGQQEAAAADSAKRLEAAATKRATLQGRAADLERKIRDLGSLPQDAFDKAYRDKDPRELMRSLEEVNRSLERFAGVNRKALDQYVDFDNQREELETRLKDQQASESKIKELISALDMRKDEAIERTFKGVAKNFREVFADLVPGGTGELVMIRAAGRAAAAAGGEDDDGEGGGGASGSDKYSGVKVKVRFAGAGEAVSMRALSGGQKTLVALALIFAIQRCDPAPFYLFDEIDAALDPQYRTTVASMLRRQAHDANNPAQFIVTTFHPQIVTEADRLFGVAHTNRISRVYAINRADALQFLQAAEEQQHDAAAAGTAAAETTDGGGVATKAGASARGGKGGAASRKAGSGRAGRPAGRAAATGRKKRAAAADEEEEEPAESSGAGEDAMDAD